MFRFKSHQRKTKSMKGKCKLDYQLHGLEWPFVSWWYSYPWLCYLFRKRNVEKDAERLMKMRKIICSVQSGLDLLTYLSFIPFDLRISVGTIVLPVLSITLVFMASEPGTLNASKLSSSTSCTFWLSLECSLVLFTSPLPCLIFGSFCSELCLWCVPPSFGSSTWASSLPSTLSSKKK